MGLPIQLKFFKKLELYQELKFQDEKALGASNRADLNKIWKTEKLILSWTARGHHLIMCPIDHGYVRNGTGLLKNKNSADYDIGLSGTFTNLIGRGFAESVEGNNTQIIFTPTGLLMGEVINDVEGINVWKKYRYPIFYYLTWATASAGALLVIFKFLEEVIFYGK
jgi:hypothetical protein